MKKIFVLVFALTLLLSGCSYIDLGNETSTSISTTEPLVTDFSGRVVPVFNDVDISHLDPGLFIKNENGRITYNSPQVQTLCGIDVSNHQGEIDWDAVATDGVDFAYIRIGYRGYGAKGIMEIDERFESNYNEARRVGIKVGVYFYSQATNEAEAIEEAEFVLEILDGRELDYPIAYDWEYAENDNARTNGMTGSQITLCAKAFCDEINNSGREVIIYFNCEIGYFEYDLNILNKHNFWLAEYKDLPSFLYRYSIWQYSCTGKVNGINGNVDLNIEFLPIPEIHG